METLWQLSSDADGHLLEPRSIWEEYTEPAYREQVIQIAKDREGIDCLKINGELRRDRNMAIAAEGIRTKENTEWI